MAVTIKSYTTVQLEEFIHSEAFNHLPDYPISKQRAISHINNPRADKDDVILYLAMLDNKIVGYRLLLVDNILHKGTTEKVAWYSCVWVDPNQRGLGIAKKMVDAALKDWELKIVFQGPVKESKQLYTKDGFFKQVDLVGIRMYARFDFKTIIKNKKPNWKLVLPFVRVADSLLNVFGDVLLNLRTPTFKAESKVLYVNEIDEELNTFLLKHQQNSPFKRAKAELNWIMKYPWVLSAPTNDALGNNYYFSSLSTDFRLFMVKLMDNKKQIKGFMLLQIREKQLSVYQTYLEDEKIAEAAQLIYQFVKTYKLNTISVFQPQLVNYFNKQTTPFLYKKPLTRAYFYSHKLAHYFEEEQLIFQAGDGDMVFT